MDSWLNGLRSSQHGQELPNKIFYATYRHLIDLILKDPRTIVIVGELPDGSIAGYSVSTPQEGLLHWLYIKEKYRNLKLASRLMAHLPRPTSGTLKTLLSEKLKLGKRNYRFLRALGQ